MKPRNNVRVALDCGNGCAGLMAPELFLRSGFFTDTIFGEIDGTFPNRESQPLEENLTVLREHMGENDIGFAFDGDADRIAVLDERGDMLSPEEVSYVILSELLKEHRGPVVVNVECTRAVDKIAAAFDRKIVRVPVGYNYLVGGIHDHNAVFGVERSGHYCIPFLAPFSDCIPVAWYAAHALAVKEEKLSDVRKEVPAIHFSRSTVFCPDNIKFQVIGSLTAKLKPDFPNLSTMDGVRIDTDAGWVLIRASNTSPNIRLTVEGETEREMKDLTKQFMDILVEELARRGIAVQEEVR